MSDESSFIDEVNEELRRERLYKQFRRYGPFVAAAIVLLVGGTAANEWRKSRAEAQAQAAGDALLTAAAAEDADARAEALSDLASAEDAPVVTAFLAAAQFVESDDLDEARRRYEAIAAGADTPPVYRDLAQFKALLLPNDGLSSDERIGRLEALTGAGAPFRALALEQIAVVHVGTGNTEAALSVLQDLILDANAPEGLRLRATQLIVALGATPGQN